MKLTDKDKELLSGWGFPDEDFLQIEEAMKETIIVYEMNNKPITRATAIRILGRETYLSGICRSAFHWSSYRNNEKGQGVYFNSSKLFQ